ncbi:hypothetical protein FQA39_LY00385 [Lamprigera yunnana]|nr:hypothetical protein FQA39_LY00385 [Lamprigera yunnana]
MELYVWIGDFGLASINFECVCTIAYIKLTEAPVQIHYSKNPFILVFEEFPVFYHKNVKLNGYYHILEYLKKKDYNLNTKLSPKQVSETYALENMIITSIRPMLVYLFWIHNDNYNNFIKLWYRSVMYFPFNCWFLRFRRERAFELLKVMYSNPDVFEEILQTQADECLTCLVHQLGNQKYFFGNQPTSLDIVVYSYLSIATKVPISFNPLSKTIETYPGLVRFVKRLHKMVFPDLNCCSNCLDKIEAKENNIDPMTTSWFTLTLMMGSVVCAMLAYAVSHNIIKFDKIHSLLGISSVVSTKSSTIVISNLSSRNNKFNYVRDYLNRYGILMVNGQDGSGLTIEDINSSEFIFALNKFQAYYKLEITKSINDETLEVMKTLRYGMADIRVAASFNLKGTFWRKDPILWHFRGATNKQIKLTTVAFQLWEKYANINFQQSFENPNIFITVKYKDHLKERDSKRCGFTLDNNELAHAFFPPADNSVSEIHINQNKDWNEELYDISKDKLSLFITLSHEIEPAIGIDHLPIHQSLIHSVYHEPTSPFNAEDFELSDDDQLAVASLYEQRKIKKKSKTTTMMTKRTFPPPHSSPPAKQP